MIFVDRSKVSAPDILTDPAKSGRKETLDAIAYFTSPPAGVKPFEFKVYRDAEVKSKLIELFNGKCAYCESAFMHVYAGDVEHFRPKGEITGLAPSKPGYYWLAAEWDNLLLACRNCNQSLTHSFHGQALKSVGGKMNQFPISNELYRARKHDDPVKTVAVENGYCKLINPCLDNPEEYFEYTIDEAVIKPKDSCKDKEKAKTSIEVFVLQRLPLVQARQERLIEILSQMQRVKEAYVLYEEVLGKAQLHKKVYFDSILKRELKVLRKFLEPNQPYLGMANQVINKFLKENGFV